MKLKLTLLPTYTFTENGEYLLIRWADGRHDVGLMSDPFARQFLAELIIMHSEGPLAQLRRAVTLLIGNYLSRNTKDYAQHDHA
ncbi:hypothetical protein ASF70_12740 [Rhizobium sp. Leaf321]|uniref:hypothetical protein n=1 Tax=Rhizobium sp. Leaf321 TaxID=1736335 RepID=UPI0007131B3F|nr:hypothetical protein [Rhizobium sp. Leaf321]KQQ72395.1 hypothetical protein ASF70_12740 [Rhizobium sp. Leaf321]